VLPYQLRIAMGVAYTEPTSVPAVIDLVRQLPRALAWRGAIQSRRTIGPDAMDRWLI